MRDLKIELAVKDFVKRNPLTERGLRSEWLNGSYISVYLRAGNWQPHSRTLPVPLVVIANVSVTENFQGRGIYTKFLEFLTKEYATVKVENVLVDDFDYEKRGFSPISESEPDKCYLFSRFSSEKP